MKMFETNEKHPLPEVSESSVDKSKAALLRRLLFLCIVVTSPTLAWAELFIETVGVTKPPREAVRFCQQNEWACSNQMKGRIRNGVDILRLAIEVNKKVNANYSQVSDERQYQKTDVWALPTDLGGDCEDFALLKKLKLIELGVAPALLSLATVLDPSGLGHAVLVVRSSKGDLVLDNRTNVMKRWDLAGYQFLKVQRPGNSSGWELATQNAVFKNIRN